MRDVSYPTLTPNLITASVQLGAKARLAAGWSSGNTLAYHTGDPGSIPGRGGSSEKCESIWGDFSSPACNPPSLIRGYTKGTGGDGRIICVRIVSCDQAQ